MPPRVLKRFIVMMALLTVGGFIFWDLLADFVRREPGDYHTQRGDQLLTAGDYDEALANFDLALAEIANHRGALMGRALVFIQTERYEEAMAELDHLIGYLERNLDPDDKTGVGALASAHANRGIVLDRMGRHQEALDSYVESLKVDQEVVEGPGVVHKILYKGDRVSTVRDRAIYLYEQLQLPEEERVLRVPEIDAQQRMYKP